MAEYWTLYNADEWYSFASDDWYTFLVDAILANVYRVFAQGTYAETQAENDATNVKAQSAFTYTFATQSYSPKVQSAYQGIQQTQKGM